MLSQRRLRDELRFVTEFQQLFDVVQQVSVSQLRRVEDRVAKHVPVSERLLRDVLPMLPATAHNHRLLQAAGRERVLVVLTSDEGLVGPLHAAVAREALARAAGPTRWVLIGQRGRRVLGAAAAQAEVMDAPSEAEAPVQMRRLAQALLRYYEQHAEVRDMWLIAPHHISAMRQTVRAVQLLPLPVAGLTPLVDERPRVMEPSLDEALRMLAECWMEALCVEAYWSGRRAELGARSMHVEVSRQELLQRLVKVRHEYFKTVHERVDRLVRETCVGRLHGPHRRAA